MVALLLAAAWFAWLRPPALGGGTSLVVVSGTSMEPTYMSGDLVVVRQTGDYRRGDPIVYGIPKGQPGDDSGARIVHRVVGGDQLHGLRTRGDNRTRTDPWTPHESDVVGEVVVHIPHGGSWLLWLLQPPIVGGIAGAFGTYLALGWSRRTTDDEDSPQSADEALAQVEDEEKVPVHAGDR